MSVGASQVDGRDGSSGVIDGVIWEKRLPWIPPHHEGLTDDRVDTVQSNT